VRRVFLRWQGSGDTAQGYAIWRADSASGPFSAVSSWDNATRCEFIDSDVKPGTRYFYKVASRNQSGTSDPCDSASATPAEAGAVPEGWTRSDIGNAKDCDAGFAGVSGRTFIVRGAGSGVGAGSDAICFVNHAVSGDACLTARLSDVAWARQGAAQKVGVMIRQSLDPDAPMFLLKLGDLGHRQAAAAARAESGHPSQWTGGNDYTWIPAWFRIKRVGNSLTAYESSDGEAWFVVRTIDLPMSGENRIGLFVSSGGDLTITGQFDHVSLTK
jgi:hypothetical protein